MIVFFLSNSYYVTKFCCALLIDEGKEIHSINLQSKVCVVGGRKKWVFLKGLS